MARSRVCACRGCEAHTGACGWPTTNERRCDRCGRPGFANRFRRTPDHPVRRTSAPGDGWRSGRSRTGWHATAGPARAGIDPPHPVRPGELAADHPGAARPRWRAAAGSARRPLRELQRAEGVEPAAALSQVPSCGRHRRARTGSRRDSSLRHGTGQAARAAGTHACGRTLSRSRQRVGRGRHPTHRNRGTTGNRARRGFG